MNAIKTLFQLAALAAIPFLASAPVQPAWQPAAQQSGSPPDGEYDWREQWPGRRASKADQTRIIKGMQGLWRMTELDVPGRFTPAQGERGYLLVSGNHMSMEIHGDWYEEDSFDPSVRGNSNRRIVAGLTQTGIHTFEINEWGKLVTRSLIGTKSTLDGAYEFEPPRTQRIYDVEASGARLVLRSDDGRSLIFKRMREVRSRTDLFGRPDEDEIVEGLPREATKRDIYGRPIDEGTDEDEPPVERPEDEEP
jgi:hypothetical protein